MRFWDTSAVVPLCVSEAASAQMRRILEVDRALAVWWCTRTECASALARRRRERALTPTGEQHAKRVLDALSEAWSEVTPTDALRARAERLLAVHPLRAADAFQLAAALVWAKGSTASFTFISLNERLRESARQEGFRLLPD